jgi:exodeoxyribonuclease VII large subunit
VPRRKATRPSPASLGPEKTPGSRAHPYSVSDLNALAREILEARFSSIYLVGEISNFKAHGSGHWYFSLKDDRAQVGAAMFRFANRMVRFKPADGMKVLARGSVGLYEPRGQYQVVVETIEPLGVGELQTAFEELKKRLRAEGLFDDSRKRPLPALPRCIGVATSPTGAAVRDILRVLQRRGADLRVLVAPCRVQGSEAAGEIVEAIRTLNTVKDVQVIIVGRGGGSLEDLWPFNEESVARAIVASRVPVVSAVGHEVDFTIADFAADLRAATPSAAAELVLRSQEELAARVGHALAGLSRAARMLLTESRARVERAGQSRALANVESRLRESLQTLDDLNGRLGRAGMALLESARGRHRVLQQRLSPRSLRVEVQARRERLSGVISVMARAVRARTLESRERLGRSAGMLQTLSPLGVLERGYAICHDAETGAVLRVASPHLEGRDVRVRLSRGALLCRVRKSTGG